MRPTRGDIRAKRLSTLPQYLFEELRELRLKKEAAGEDVIDLSIGDPDLGAPPVALEALKAYAGDKRLHAYTPHFVVERFAGAVSKWMKRRYEVDLDPGEEILPLVGTKEGIAHLPLAVLDPGAAALVPDPGYPVYSRGTWFAGGKVEWMPLREDAGYLGDPDLVRRHRPRLVFVNYPNNPTSAVAVPGFFARLVEAGLDAGALVANDAAYAEIGFEGYLAPSILSERDAMETAIEFHSFSKTFSMAGWRLGFAAGNRRAIKALGSLKSNIDSGVFGPILMAGVAALESGWDWCEKTLAAYAERRCLILEGLEAAGIAYHESPATLYVWARVPGGSGSIDFARLLLERSGILVAPGAGFGAAGEGYFRISVTCPTERVRAAALRIREVKEAWTK
jgi:LL-diaminopimelate aminotransferase